MIVVMKPGASQEQIDHVIQLVRRAGLKDHPIYGTELTVIACIGDKRNLDMSALETAAGVDRTMPILSPYKRASVEVQIEPTVVPLGAAGSVGGSHFGAIAGPCSVEDRKCLIEVAHAVKEAGAIGLRGGAFKPRTDPYSFQGLGESGLELLALAAEETGLAVVTEVMSLEQVDLVARYADVLQIGTRNMHNFNLLQRVGQSSKSVLLKRGWSATLDEFLLAAEYILNEGNGNVILCERGIRTSEDYVRNTLALGIIPAAKRRSHLPMIVDPSHGTGHAYMVPAMCRAAMAAGADGVLVEVHPDPEHALTDGAQSITPEAFAGVMRDLRKIAPVVAKRIE